MSFENLPENMAESCLALFDRLGLDAPKTVAALSGTPEAIKKISELRHGKREEFRKYCAQLISNMWFTGAMPFDNEESNGYSQLC